MESVPCPQKDKGVCTIPDKTAVVKGGVVSMQSRAEIEQSLPDLDLSGSNLRPLKASFDTSRLMETLDWVSTAVEQDSELATEVLERTGVATAVLVNCTCGHVYVAEA